MTRAFPRDPERFVDDVLAAISRGDVVDPERHLDAVMLAHDYLIGLLTDLSRSPDVTAPMVVRVCTALRQLSELRPTVEESEGILAVMRQSEWWPPVWRYVYHVFLPSFALDLPVGVGIADRAIQPVNGSRLDYRPSNLFAPHAVH